jgi:hypothetical protein
MADGLSNMSNERMARLLWAKAGELEAYVKPRLGGPGTTDLDWLIADLALIASVVAAFIERTADHDEPIVTKTGKVLTDADIQALADEAEAGYPVCPGCKAIATKGPWGWETVHEDDCSWMHDPDSEPYS